MDSVCRVVLYSSLAYSTLNHAIIEFTVPDGGATTNGMLMCFTTPGMYVRSETFFPNELQEGGDQFSAPTTLYSSLEDAFWKVAQRNEHSEVEYGNVRDVLGSDPYYATSYTVARYDDFVVDGAGASLAGVVAVEETPEESGTPAGRRQANCVLLSGGWLAGNRYQLNMTVENPPPPASRKPYHQPRETPESLGIWVAPVSYSRPFALAPPKGMGRRDVYQYHVQGSKYGTVCAPREGTATALYDACAAARGTSPPLTTSTNAADCVAAIAACTAPGAAACAASTAGLPNVFPSSIADRAGAAAACPAGSAYSARFGGECVPCGRGAAAAAGGCDCAAAGQVAAPVGAGCREAAGLQGTEPEVLAKICSEMTAEKERLFAGAASDRVLVELSAGLLADLAPGIFDRAWIATLNATFWELYVSDPRSSAPTRELGVTSCASCEGTSDVFTDYATGKPAHVVDLRFMAVQTLRLIGYLLNEKRSRCPALWDSNEPLKVDYGPYDAEICKAL